MKKQVFLLTLLAVITFSACAQTDHTNSTPAVNNNVPIVNRTPVTNSAPVNTVSRQAAENECRICDFDFASYKGELKKEEVDGLLLALNDEYLAMATYEQVNRDFNNPRPFVNIVEAEARHAARLKSLFALHQIPVPDNPWAGNVTKFTSLAEACRAGVQGEIANRDLYEKLFKSTAREDILIVYRALQRASEENHLPAFERCGTGGGRGRRGRP